MNIPFFNTYVNPDAISKIKEVLDSTFLGEGQIVKEFETGLSKELGLKNVCAINSGTAALDLALKIIDIKPGDEVICTPQTFIASGLSVLYQGAKPVFADIQYETGNIDPVSIKSKITNKTKAIMPVHWGGYPCDLDEINAIAKQHNLYVIEDAAHALGAKYKGQTIGSISDFTCFSFQSIKHLTTGDGGALCCKNEDHLKMAVVKRWFGIDRDKARGSAPITGGREWNIAELGYKYHMNNYTAALGVSNLVGINDRLKRRKAIAQEYRKSLSNVTGLSLFEFKEDREHAWWLFGVHVEKREDFAKMMKEKGIQVSVVDRRIDSNSIFGGISKDLSNMAKFDETQIHIPVHEALTDEQVQYIIASIKEGW